MRHAPNGPWWLWTRPVYNSLIVNSAPEFSEAGRRTFAVAAKSPYYLGHKSLHKLN